MSSKGHDKGKRKCFSIEEKGAIVARLENGESNVKLALEFGVSHSTISTIWKNKDKIVRAFNENELKTKKLRRSQYDDVDKSLLEWFKIQRSKNVPISGPILRQKANEFAALLGKNDFQCSEGWISRFRVRHNIVFGKICGEAASVPDGVTESWLNTVFKEIRKGYADEEIFNADETGLFFRMTNDKTMRFKGEKCTGGKLSKDRITVLVAANLTGSQKRKLLVIGKSKNPRCFKNIRNLPVIYDSNKRAWMTSELFVKFVRDWDNELSKSGKKVLLLVDNCPAHPVVGNLKAIKLSFLPPNCTSVLQPLDQGIINSLKTHYRKMQTIETIKNLELNKECKITLLDAILMVSAAWEKVTETTIRNCFAHAGFLPRGKEVGEKLVESVENFDEEDDIPLAQWANLTRAEFTEFVNIDQDLATCADFTDEEIARTISDTTVTMEDDDRIEEQDGGDDTDLKMPTCAEALQAIGTLRKFILFGGIEDSSLIENVARVESKITYLYCQSKCKKQTLITDFFSQ